MSTRVLIGGTYCDLPYPLLGWEPDDRNPLAGTKNIHDSPLADASGEGDCDNRLYFKEVSDQFGYPSCTANAGADALEAALVRRHVREGFALEHAKVLVPHLSRMFAWYWGRSMMDPDKSSNAAAGCFNRLIMEVIQTFGLPPESYWPYDEAIMQPKGLPRAVTRPSVLSMKMAQPWKSDELYSIPCEDNEQLILGIDRALYGGYNVVWGTGVGQEFQHYEGGVLSVPSLVVGRHAMVLCGKEGSNYWCRNSWSSGWGLDGYCLVSPEYITWSCSSSFWVLTADG